MILFILILILLAGGLLAWMAGSRNEMYCRAITLFALSANLAIVLYLWVTSGTLQLTNNGQWMMEYNQPWIERFGINLRLALDGLSLVLLALTYLLGLIAVFVSRGRLKERAGFFHFNVLWLLAGISGVFLAMDLFLFYFFWELMLVPMYFIIGIWGHERRVYATLKFFLFTQAGGLLMFISILALYFIHGSQTGNYTFDLSELIHTDPGRTASWLLMGGFMIAFLVKLPVVPFHSWLPDAHTEAPTAGSVLLAGLLLKTGAYGLLRFVIPLFPETVIDFAPAGMIIGVAGILYGAKLAFAQTDMKRMVAYTSVSHMGFVMLGVFALNELAFQGVVVQMLAHGLSASALFIIAGNLQDQTHTRDLESYGGYWTLAPKMGGITLIFVLASLGLPGMAGFIGEFLTILGSYQSNVLIAILATLGLIVSVIYSLKLFQRSFYGEVSKQKIIRDFNWRELLIMTPLVFFTFWIGLYPQTILSVSEEPVQVLLKTYKEGDNNGDIHPKAFKFTGQSANTEAAKKNDH